MNSLYNSYTNIIILFAFLMTIHSTNWLSIPQHENEDHFVCVKFFKLFRKVKGLKFAWSVNLLHKMLKKLLKNIEVLRLSDKFDMNQIIFPHARLTLIIANIWQDWKSKQFEIKVKKTEQITPNMLFKLNWLHVTWIKTF